MNLSNAQISLLQDYTQKLESDTTKVYNLFGEDGNKLKSFLESEEIKKSVLNQIQDSGKDLTDPIAQTFVHSLTINILAHTFLLRLLRENPGTEVYVAQSYSTSSSFDQTKPLVSNSISLAVNMCSFGELIDNNFIGSKFEDIQEACENNTNFIIFSLQRTLDAVLNDLIGKNEKSLLNFDEFKAKYIKTDQPVEKVIEDIFLVGAILEHMNNPKKPLHDIVDNLLDIKNILNQFPGEGLRNCLGENINKINLEIKNKLKTKEYIDIINDAVSNLKGENNEPIDEYNEIISMLKKIKEQGNIKLAFTLLDNLLKQDKSEKKEAETQTNSDLTNLESNDDSQDKNEKSSFIRRPGK